MRTVEALGAVLLEGVSRWAAGHGSGAGGSGHGELQGSHLGTASCLVQWRILKRPEQGNEMLVVRK